LITTDDILDPIAGTAREYATLRDRCWYASARTRSADLSLDAPVAWLVRAER
jgi:hypothetical protein